MIVVDTNIIAHFWLPSDQSAVIDEFFQRDSNWIAPILWKSEFRNIVTLYLKRNFIDLAGALQLTEKAELQMKDKEFQVNLIQVYNFSLQSGCSAYDCEFLSLAEELNINLVTMDKQILRSFPNIAISPAEVT